MGLRRWVPILCVADCPGASHISQKASSRGEVVRTATVTTADIVPALSAYARRFHAGVDKEHHVASPLGAWMLLALCAPGSEGRLRNEITEILGVDVDTAAAFAGSLLDAPHPAVALAAGAWTSRRIPA